jgi:uncharacterized protein (TIGR03067 family)
MKVAMATGTVAGQERPGFTPPSVEELARKFPQLEIIELIGRGGMGAVYKARQKELDRIVALKILPPGIGDDASFAERFAREAKALARLNHPGIITIHDFGRADGLYFFVMEFVDGVNLRQLLAASRVSPREALAIVPQICDALQFAHDQGIVHRDIKPENILLDRRGRVKVADFGLAKLVESNVPLTPSLSPSDGERVASRPGEGKTPALTDAGKVIGTPAYMAPEQVEHPAEVDHRADIYALGVVFYQMLTGELPAKAIEPPSKKVHIDVRLDEVVLRALEKKPELRYQQVSDIKTMLETIAGTAEVPVAEPGVGKGLPIGRTFTKEESEQLGRDIARLFTRQGLISFAKRSSLWLAGQVLLLFDLFETTPTFVEREGRRRFNFWPFALLFCSNIGFMVNGLIFATSLVGRLRHGGSSALTGEERVMFQWMVLFAVGRLAALNLGCKVAAGAGSTQSPLAITPWRVVCVLLNLLGLAALVFVTALSSNWLNKLPTTALIKIARSAPWIVVTIAVSLVLAVGLWLTRFYSRVFREIREKTVASAVTRGLPAVEAWLAIVDGGDYAQSWEAAAAYFQRHISKEEWVRQLEHVRRPLGKVRSRKLSPPTFKANWTSFGAKFVFATSFDGLPAATETVTFARQAPIGEWKAIGYLITPAGDGKEGSEFCVQQSGALKTEAEPIAATSTLSKSQGEAANADTTKPRQDWLTWSPLQSQAVGEICSHLTKAERNHFSVLGLLYSVWIVGTCFGIPAFVRSDLGSGKWIVAAVWAILFIVSVPMLQRMVRHFLCSTTWAREHGLAPERLRLFSFSRGNLWKVCAVLAVGLGLIMVQSRLLTRLSGTSELSASLKEHATQTKELSARLAAGAKSLQGTWNSPDIDASGTGWPSLVVKGSNLVFHGMDTNYWFKAAFSLREDTNPKQLAAVVTECADPQYVGKTANAIYLIQDGTLTITLNEAGDPAVPADFDAPGADKFLFKRKPN